MALARLALKNLQQRVAMGSSPSSSLSNVEKQRWGSELLKRLSSSTTTSADEKSDGREISVSEGGKKSKLFQKKKHKRGLWRNPNRDFVPALHGLGNALVQATQNMNRVLESLSPSRLISKFKEKDDCYKLRFYLPGISKEELKIKVEDGVLYIMGEHKEEEEEGSDDEFWATAIYGYINTSMVLPEDAKIDEIKAEVKDGVLNITIPRTEKPKKDVKEVPVE